MKRKVVDLLDNLFCTNYPPLLMSSKNEILTIANVCLESMAGSLILATGRTDFEDGPRIGNQSEVGNSLQRVRTIPENS